MSTVLDREVTVVIPNLGEEVTVEVANLSETVTISGENVPFNITLNNSSGGFTLPLVSTETYDFVVNWGDGTANSTVTLCPWDTIWL